MHPKTLRLLAVVTVPVTAVAIFAPKGDITLSAASGSAVLLPDLASKLGQDVTLTISGPAGKVVLRHRSDKPDQGWVLAEAGGYPVPPDKIKPVLQGLKNLRGVAPKTARPALYERLGLNDPGAGAQSHRLTVAAASGAELASIVLGRTKTDAQPGGDERIYARVPPNPQTWLAAPAITLPYDKLDWIDHSVISIPESQIKQITLTQSSTTQSLPAITLARAKAGDKLELQDLAPGTKPKSDTSGAEIAGSLSALELADVRPASQLTAQPAARLHAVTFDGLSIDLALIRQDNKPWVTLTATGGKQAGDITARTRGWAYQISDVTASGLQTKLADLVAVAPGEKK